MKENKVIKFLIPLIAAVVVFESIVLVTSLDKNSKIISNSNTTENTEVTEQEKTEEPVAEFIFSTDVKEMKIGKSYKVTVNLSSKENKMIDGVETYIKYDAESIKIASLITNNEIAKPELSEVNDKEGIVKNIILIDDKKGLSIKKGELLSLFTFTLTPKKEGSYSLKFNGGGDDKNYATLVVENTTSKSLGWVGNELMINVTK